MSSPPRTGVSFGGPKTGTSFEKDILASAQGGGIGTHTVPPPTTKRRTTNFKTKNKNCQKIELYGSPTTKELNKTHSSSLVGGEETGSQAERTPGEAVAGRPGRSHIHEQTNREEQMGSETDPQPRAPAQGKKASKPLTENTCGG